MKPRPRLAHARAFYAEELRLTSGGVSDEIEEAFAHVPREDYLAPPPWRLGAPMSFRLGLKRKRVQTSDPRQLYHNVLVALDRNRNNGMPSLWYVHFEATAPSRGERVLHVGCGTGYYSAILSRLVGPSGSVVAVEVNRKLAQRARSNLRRLKNVEFVAGDATKIDEPVDVIVVSAGVALPPRQWLEMLRVGGRIAIPITGARGHGASFLFTKRRVGMTARFLMPVSFSHCAGTRDAPTAQAVDEAIRSGHQKVTQVKKVLLDDHSRNDSCWLHTPTMCLSS